VPLESTVTTKQVQDEVRKIAAEFPDVLYAQRAAAGCLYAPDPGNPHGCLIGFALRRLGVTELDERAEEAEGIMIEWPGEFPDTKALHEALMWLVYAQDYQDEGYSWSASVAAADFDADAEADTP